MLCLSERVSVARGLCKRYSLYLVRIACVACLVVVIVVELSLFLCQMFHFMLKDKLKNEIVLIAQEEVIFPVYMPWAFAYGDLAALKEAITKS